MRDISDAFADKKVLFAMSGCSKGSHHLKKKRNFMKKFHKTVTPPPRTAFVKSLFRILTVFLSTYVFLNKRYEIPPTFLRIFIIKFSFFMASLSRIIIYDEDNNNDIDVRGYGLSSYYVRVFSDPRHCLPRH